MRKPNTNNIKTKSVLLASAAATLALSATCHAQSSDALIDKLVDKGILSAKEAQDLRDDADKNFSTAFQAKTGMPDWVTGYKLGGDFRGRFDQFSSLAGNAGLVDRTRYRYRLRFGITASLMDNLEAGFRLASGDAKGIGSQANAGNPNSANTTFQDNFTRKAIYIDNAYGKWTPINSGGWLLSATVGKMDSPFSFTPMVFDPDLTPEGAVLQSSYAINDRNTVSATGAAFVLDEESGTSHDPFIWGGQVLWNATWSPKISSSLGIGGFQIANADQESTNNVPYVNQGNTRGLNGVLANQFDVLIADASMTYTFDKAPFYNGAFPVKFAAEFIDNAGASQKNQGYWAGVTFGKSGTKRTWDISYRYEYLEADAWYDQLVDDDNGAFYQNTPSGGGKGYFGGTNIKGHLLKLNYSFTDSLTFTATCYINDLISTPVNNGINEPKNSALHFMADVMWKF